MYQQIPLPLSAFLLSTALPAVFLSAALSPYGDPSGAQPPHRGGLRAWAVVLIALGTFSLVSLPVSFYPRSAWQRRRFPIIAGANMTIHITTARPIPMG
mgnify:CR=1 FL=1